MFADWYHNKADGEPLVMSIYTKRVFTVAAYQHYLVYGTGDLSVDSGTAFDNTVEACKKHNVAVDSDMMMIKRVRSLNNPGALVC